MALLIFVLFVFVPALASCAVQYSIPRDPVVTAPVPPVQELAPNEQEAALGRLLTGSPEQRRARLTYSPVLARVAREKALDMARRSYFGHTDPDGMGPNELVERAGYLLPEAYDRRLAGNNIESLGRQYGSAESVWRQWMGSQAHRAHLLGLQPVFAEQDEYGVGYVGIRGVGNFTAHYWVVLIARRR